MEKYEEKLPEGISLRLYSGNELIFENGGKWLHPLFAAEDFLSGRTFTDLRLHDTVSGTAAAFLAARLGIERVHADMASTGALAVYEHFGIKASFGTLVDRILCRTEELFTPDSDPDEVYAELSVRAGRVRT